MFSIWSDTATLPSFEQLQNDITTDVLIIGGGITGILCAWMLHQSGVHYTLVEANTICSGISKNTTAKITSQHGLLYHKLQKKFGLEKTQMYLDANQAALHQYKHLCQSINCDFETKDSFVYSLHDLQQLEQELETLNKLKFPAQYTEHLPLPISTVGAVQFPNQAQFHPLQFLANIANKLHIYEHTMVTNLSRTTAITPHGNINAEKIIVATHFPFINRHGSYFLKMYQHRSYVLALKNAADVKGMYVDEAENGLSFRNYKDFLLIGGGDHRTGKQGGNWTELSQFARNHYPNSLKYYQWATQDCMSLDDVPYIGQYSLNTPNLYVATGFHKWGMTTSMVAATILRDMVLEKENPYAPVFSPSRTMLRPQLAINIFEATKNLLTFSHKRCPHMGCALKWNPQERTWDCPCHGSRFEEEGALINNPAMRDLL